MAKDKVTRKKISEESLIQKEESKVVEAVVSLDEVIGKGLTPSLDHEKKDYENHPKFNKFNQAGGL